MVLRTQKKQTKSHFDSLEKATNTIIGYAMDELLNLWCKPIEQGIVMA